MRWAARVDVAWAAAATVSLAAVMAMATVPTTLKDFFGPGTQPFTLIDPVYSAVECAGCHADYDAAHEPFGPWAASMMGQAARDPVFWACMAVAGQDAAFAGDLCLRCHTPGAWLAGRSTPTDGSGLIGADFQGVSCDACHRMVNPVYKPGQSPPEDDPILAALEHHPVNPHSGQYVIDPLDRRRGPFDLGNFDWHAWLPSPFHSQAAMCATCHDVSNPVFERQPDGRYALGPLDAPHPTHDKYDEFPVERTYSEWLMSAFAKAPIEMGGRFGGNKTAVSSCQDCHMPDATGKGCAFGEDRPDLPPHYFNGGNTWVLRAVHALNKPSDTFLTDDSVSDSVARTEEMLRAASDLELDASVPGSLRVRVVNQSGHKLPTGYPEGRRMWVNVRFLDTQGHLVREHGAYDAASAMLTTEDTKVYEAVLGLDEAMAALTGLAAGPGFHFAINNTWFLDNRIPPRGFTNEGFSAVQAGPVGYSYGDGEYWDDTTYAVPPGAATAEVRVFYQTSSREYIEFLRDENRTNNAGQVLYDQWLAQGRSTPVEMDSAAVAVVGGCAADLTGDGRLDLFDFLMFFNLFNAGASGADLDGDGAVDLFDFLNFVNSFNAGC